MQKIKRILTLLILLCLCLIVIGFTLENRQLVQLSFIGYSMPSVPLALLVLLAFIAGLLIGPLLGWWQIHRLKCLCRKQAKQIERFEQCVHTEQRSDSESVTQVAPVLTKL